MPENGNNATEHSPNPRRSSNEPAESLRPADSAPLVAVGAGIYRLQVPFLHVLWRSVSFAIGVG